MKRIKYLVVGLFIFIIIFDYHYKFLTQIQNLYIYPNGLQIGSVRLKMDNHVLLISEESYLEKPPYQRYFGFVNNLFFQPDLNNAWVRKIFFKNFKNDYYFSISESFFSNTIKKSIETQCAAVNCITTSDFNGLNSIFYIFNETKNFENIFNAKTGWMIYAPELGLTMMVFCTKSENKCYETIQFE